MWLCEHLCEFVCCRGDHCYLIFDLLNASDHEISIQHSNQEPVHLSPGHTERYKNTVYREMEIFVPILFFPLSSLLSSYTFIVRGWIKTGQISLHVWKGQKNGAQITLYTVLFKVQHYEKTKNIMQCKLQLQWWNYFGHYQWCSWTCLNIKLLKCLITFQAEMWIKTVPNNLVHFLQIFERSFRHSVFLFFCCLVELPLRLNAVSFPLSRTWPTWETESNRTN